VIFLLGCTSAPPSSGTPGGESAGETGETGESAAPAACPDGDVVTFTGEDGSTGDVTAYFETGDYLTLDAPGTLSFCPGTWFARVVVRADLSVVGLGAAPEDTVLSAGEIGTILDFSGPDATMTVANLTLDRGAGLDVEHNSGGGGVYCYDGTVSVEGVVFSNNFANDGAGLYADTCDVEVRDSSFLDNLADDDGGAMTLWYSTATLEGVSFSGNQALDGGALAVFYSAASLTGVTVADNTATHFAGGIWASESTLAMADSTVERNTNTSSDQGGGLLINGEATLADVVFSANQAALGGGLFVYYQAVVTVQSCDFSENTADDVWVADYSEVGGYSMAPGTDASFTCGENVCQ
jgi:hypothetical protein